MKTMKKILCTVLVVVMCLTSAPLGGFVGLDFKAAATEYQVGDIIQFGSYPQSEVKDSATITALNNKAPAWDNWTSYGYYSGEGWEKYGTMVQGDWMRYTDVMYGGNKYRGVKFTQYRPYCTYYSSSSTYQADNGYETDTVYWFKFEPIDWRILDPATGLVMCETIIDSQPYSNTFYKKGSGGTYGYFNDASHTNYASDYETSFIRKWLNEDFYNTAFSSSQQKIIKSTALNNDGYYTSVGTTGYEALDSNSTNDKIFLLSFNEVRNSDYGFSSDYSDHDKARQAKSSDYAKSQGLCVSYSENSSWLLRSPGYSYGCCGVYYYGSSGYNLGISYPDYGIRPALCLTMSSDADDSGEDDNNNQIDTEAENDAFVQQHLLFRKAYYDYFTNNLRWANEIWKHMDTWKTEAVEFAYDIIEGALEIVSLQFLDGLEVAANPYDVILLDFLASNVSQSHFAKNAEEDAFSVAVDIVNKAIKIFSDDSNWEPDFDIKKEVKLLITSSDYSQNNLYLALDNLHSGNYSNEIKKIFNGFDCFGQVMNAVTAGAKFADMFVELLRYTVAIEGFYNSTAVFKSALDEIAAEMEKNNPVFASYFEKALEFFEDSLTYDSIVDYVIKNKGVGGTAKLIYDMSTNVISDATVSYVMKAFKVSKDVAKKVNAVLWSAEVGWGLSNLLTGNNVSIGCRRMLRANYALDVATYNVMERFGKILDRDESYGAALLFDSTFNIFKMVQIYSLDQYKTYCENMATRPFTFNKSEFKNEDEFITAATVTWKDINCHYVGGSSSFRTSRVDTLRVACPTDVYVYRKADNKLVASVINNKSKLYDDSVAILCIDGEKSFAATDMDDYRIEIKATDNGTMDVIYNSYSDFKNTKKLSFDDVPIKSGNKYELDDEKESIKRDDNVEYKTDGRVDNCSCNCHKGGIKGFFFKFLLFFQKIFRTNKVCKCGINHY